jgi:hypothetical protein
MRSEHFAEEFRVLHSTRVCITTYCIGDEFHCHVSNADPGATIARASAKTRKDAQRDAISKALERLSIVRQ